MKQFKLFLGGIVSLAAVSALFAACQNQYADLADDLTRPKSIELSKVDSNNQQELKALKAYLASNNQIPTKSNVIAFDSSKITEYHIVNSDMNFYFVPQINFDEKNTINFSSGYVMNGTEIKVGVVIKEELLTTNIKR